MTPPRELTSIASFDERLRDVFTLHATIPVLNEYVASIQIHEHNPGFVLSWNLDNLHAFVAAANGQNSAPAPSRVRIPPSYVTADSFINDVVYELEKLAGNRYGRVLLAPNTLTQFLAVGVKLIHLQNDDFIVHATEAAFPMDNMVEGYIATTYNLTYTRAERSVAINLQPPRRNDQPLCRIFI